MSEFNLGEKAVQYPHITSDGFTREDVKEFIKRLKERLTLELVFDGAEFNQNLVDQINEAKDVIVDKLAGEKLC